MEVGTVTATDNLEIQIDQRRFSGWGQSLSLVVTFFSIAGLYPILSTPAKRNPSRWDSLFWVFSPSLCIRKHKFQKHEELQIVRPTSLNSVFVNLLFCIAKTQLLLLSVFLSSSTWSHRRRWAFLAIHGWRDYWQYSKWAPYFTSDSYIVYIRWLRRRVVELLHPSRRERLYRARGWSSVPMHLRRVCSRDHL